MTMSNACADENEQLSEVISEIESSDSGAAWTPLDVRSKGNVFVRALNDVSTEGSQSLEDRENEDILAMRKIWAVWVLVFIGIIIVFDIILVYFYGTEVWTFEDSKVVMVVITENFLKIIGLGLLIANSIFKKIF